MSQDRAVQDSVEGYCPDVDGVRGEGVGEGGEPQCSVMWSVAWCPLLQGELHILYVYVLYISVYIPVSVLCRFIFI